MVSNGKLMTVEMGDYGAVKVISGPHVGRIGYYDDDEFELIEDNMDSPDECSDEESILSSINSNSSSS